jgi:hypothetical protein
MTAPPPQAAGRPLLEQGYGLMKGRIEIEGLLHVSP